MRVFLTGSTGFVGSCVLRQMLEKGDHEVAILVRNLSAMRRLEGQLASGIELIEGDLRNQAGFEAKLAKFRPDAVVHLAWEGVMGSQRNSLHQWRNVPQALELIEMTDRVGARHWIGLGSQAEYGPCENRINETQPARPTTLYGASKLATYTLGEHLCAQLGLRMAWLRLFSSFGPADNPEWLIPYVINSLMAGERPSLTAAEQLWDYIFVEDVAAAVNAVLSNQQAVGVFNLGSGRATSLRSIIEKIRDLIDPNLKLGFGDLPYRSDQVMHLEADISRLKNFAGWEPMHDLDSALITTIAWYKRTAA